jgi:AraC-like DNA-binding protein
MEARQARGGGMDFRATSEYPENDPLEVWIGLSAGQACPVEHVRLGSEPFEAQMRGVPLGARAVVLEFTESPHECRRTPRMISRSAAGYLAFLMHDGPPGLIEQDGRQTVMHPGRLTFYDVTRPSTLTFPGSIRSDLLLVERDAFDIGSRSLAELTARSMPAERGTAAVLRSLLAGLAPRLTNYPAESADRLGSCVIDLAELLLQESLDDAITTAGGERTLLMRITAYLEQRLHDPGLCPEQIAKAHHISTRYLSKLFAAEETTVMTWVRERRLERCRSDLVDPRLRDRPIAAVAARWGFLQPAHFSRAFRAQYGTSPREYRLAAGAQGTGVVFDLNRSRNSAVPSSEDRIAHIAGGSSKRSMNSSATR